MSILPLENRMPGEDAPTYFIADIAANHNGDLERAKYLIRLAAEVGADCAKFQNFTANSIVSDFGFKNLGGRQSHQGKWEKSVFEVYSDASIPESWNPVLAGECRRAGIDYSTSPYDFTAVDQTCELSRFIKIGSGDITWREMLVHIASKGKPVLLACGASTMEEVEVAVETILPVNSRLALLQCNTNYEGGKGNFRHLNLRVLTSFRKRWPELALGLSDHTPGDVAVLGAIALGARIIEKHFTDDNNQIGPDHSFSMTPPAWREMVDRARLLEAALGDGVKRVEENELQTVVLQRRCLRVARDLPAGHVVTREDVEALRPAPSGALPLKSVDEITGMRLRKAMVRGEELYPRSVVR